MVKTPIDKLTPIIGENSRTVIPCRS